MQPNPTADTSSPLLPRVRVIIALLLTCSRSWLGLQVREAAAIHVLPATKQALRVHAKAAHHRRESLYGCKKTCGATRIARIAPVGRVSGKGLGPRGTAFAG